MRTALGVALVFGALFVGAIAAIFVVIAAGDHGDFTPQLFALVGVTGAVAVASMIVGVRLLRDERSADVER